MKSIDEVLITSELAARPSRSPDYEAQSLAMLELGDELRNNPANILQKVADLAMRLCRADSAGISILEPEGEREIFRWHAIAGAFAPNIWGSLPRDFSPCGTVIECNRVLLFNEPDRFYSELRGVSPRIYESLLAPWPDHGPAEGTLWVIAHSPERHFDAEDSRIVQILARFAWGTHHMMKALDRAIASNTDLEKRVAESAYLLSDAFKALRKEAENRDRVNQLRKQAEKAMRESERLAAAGRLNALFAHEIGAPLDIVSNLLYMAEYAASGPEARRYLAKAQTELIRMQQTANRLRGPAGQAPARNQPAEASGRERAPGARKAAKSRK